MRLKNDPSRRVRFELVYWRVHRLRSQNVPSNPIKPYPTGRSLFCREAATQNSPYGTKATRHTVQQKGTQHQTNLSRTRTKRFARCAKSKERSKRRSRKGCRSRTLRASRQE